MGIYVSIVNDMNIYFSKNNMEIYHNCDLLLIWHTKTPKKEKQKNIKVKHA
jgi:hypothetical protein